MEREFDDRSPQPSGEVHLSREAAYLLSRLLEEIVEIDRRAGCSDRYFRQHFMSVVCAASASGTLAELRARLSASGSESA